MIDDSREDPLTDAELEEEVRACLARGLEPCAGVDCERWLDPVTGQVVVRTAAGDCYCGDCAMLHDDAASVQDVAVSLLARGVVLGRRFSLGAYTPAVPGDDDPDWAVVGRTGVAYLAHDAFEAARWFCRLESGDFGYDPAAPPMVHPTDRVLAQLDFTQNYWHLIPQPRRSP